MHFMTPLQKLIYILLPQRWAKKIEEASKEWFSKCSCGKESSVWDLGGIRFKGKGNPRRYFYCSKCKKRTWHILYKK